MNYIVIALVVTAIISGVATTGFAILSVQAGGPGPGGGNGGDPGDPPGPRDVQRNPGASVGFRFQGIDDAANSLKETTG
jgi:hypothetical protein